MKKHLSSFLNRHSASQSGTGVSSESSSTFASEDGTKDPARLLLRAAKAYTEGQDYIQFVLNSAVISDDKWQTLQDCSTEMTQLSSQDELYRRLSTCRREFEQTVNEDSAVRPAATDAYSAALVQIATELSEQQPEVGKSILLAATRLQGLEWKRKRKDVPEFARRFLAALEQNAGGSSGV